MGLQHRPPLCCPTKVIGFTNVAQTCPNEGGTAGNHGDETSSDPKKDQPPTNSQVRG